MRKKIDIYSKIGNWINWVILKCTNFRCFRQFQKISREHFEYPIRIKATGIVGLAVVLLASIAVRSI